MIDLGNSTNMVAADAASDAARFANIMGMSQDKFQNLGSTLVDLGNNYATTESEIMEMSLRLPGAGKQVGLSEAQIMGFAAALSSVGIQAQMGGSACFAFQGIPGRSGQHDHEGLWGRRTSGKPGAGADRKERRPVSDGGSESRSGVHRYD